jgi:hypothetical protein
MPCRSAKCRWSYTYYICLDGLMRGHFLKESWKTSCRDNKPLSLKGLREQASIRGLAEGRRRPQFIGT